MDPVSSLNSIALLLRKRLLEKAAKDPSNTKRLENAELAESSLPSLDDEIQNALHALQSVSDGGTDRQHLRRVITLVLRQNFGEALENDAGFQRVVDAVVAAVADDPDLVSSLKDETPLSGA